MHFLLIHAYFLPPDAPGSIRWNEIGRLWGNSGHTLTVITGNIDYTTGKPYGAKTIQNEQHPAFIKLLRVPMSTSYNKGTIGRLWAYFRFFISSLWAGLRISDRCIDVIIATSPPLTTGLTGWLLSLFYGKPLVLELRDLWPDAPVQMGYLRNPVAKKLAYWLELFLYRKAQRIVVLSPAFQDVLIAHKKIAANKVTSIPNGADFELIDQLNSSFDRVAFRRQYRMHNRFSIVYTGAHGPANNLSIILQVAQHVRHLPVQFVLVGNGPDKGKLQSTAQRMNLNNVHFHDADSKQSILPFILAADAGLVSMQPLPIFGTMLSAKLFDYFACRKPVLTAINGFSRSVIESANAGCFVDPTNPDDWIEPISRYLSQPELGPQQGENGYRLARQQFNREAQAMAYLSEIKQFIADYSNGVTFSGRHRTI